MRDKAGLPLVPEFFYVPRDKVHSVITLCLIINIILQSLVRRTGCFVGDKNTVTHNFEIHLIQVHDVYELLYVFEKQTAATTRRHLLYTSPVAQSLFNSVSLLN